MTGDLPSGWESVSVGDLCSVEYGKSLSKKLRIGTGSADVYGSAGLVGHHDCALVEEPVIVIGRKGNAGSVWLTNGPSWPIDTTYFLRPPREISPEFLAWQLGSRDLVEKDSSTTIPSLRRPDLEVTPIAVAPIGEQERIVAAIEEHFSRLDAVNSAIEAAQQQLEAFRRSSFQDLFDRPDWPWTTLGQIAEVKGGITKDSKNQGNPDYVEVPYLRVANVQRGFLDLEEVTTIRVKPEKALSLELKPGDMLFNEGGDRDKLGRGWVWEGQVEGCIHQNHVFRARLTGEAFDPYFVSMHGNTWGQRWFETHGKQTTNLASLNLTTLKSFPVPSPSLSEQREVVGQLRTVMEMGDSLQADLNQAKRHIATLRRSILSDAFSGRLVPQDPDGEPSSVLLERIADSRRPV